MKYETFTSIKGWVALLVLGIGFLCCISALGPGHTLQDRAAATSVFFAGVGIGISWIRSRKHIRETEYQARMLRKGLYRIRPRTHRQRLVARDRLTPPVKKGPASASWPVPPGNVSDEVMEQVRREEREGRNASPGSLR